VLVFRTRLTPVRLPALITTSTRASLRRFHAYTLTLGLGERADEYEFLRVGSVDEKIGVERELKELKERLGRVGEWEARKREIEVELGRVWVRREEGEGKGVLEAPGWLSGEGVEGEEDNVTG